MSRGVRSAAANARRNREHATVAVERAVGAAAIERDPVERRRKNAVAKREAERLAVAVRREREAVQQWVAQVADELDGLREAGLLVGVGQVKWEVLPAAGAQPPRLAITTAEPAGPRPPPDPLGEVTLTGLQVRVLHSVLGAPHAGVDLGHVMETVGSGEGWTLKALARLHRLELVTVKGTPPEMQWSPTDKGRRWWATNQGWV